jgi:hypothetical protein
MRIALFSIFVFASIFCLNAQNNKSNNIIQGIVNTETVTDIDGNIYPTVIIGNQLWMAENLRVFHYNNGDEIVTGLSDSQWETTINGAYVIYPHTDIDGLNSDEECLILI